MTLLRIENLRKEYVRGGRSFAAIDDLNLSVGQGEFVCIAGRSGSGKTTLLNLTAGLLQATAGTVALNGRVISELGDAEASALRNAHIGHIPQGAALLPNLDVLDNIRLPFYLSKREGNASSRARFLLEEVRLTHLAEMFPADLSGGEQRRVAIARALMNAPELLIADEPTGDLDTETTAEIMNLFSEVNARGTTLLIVTHEQDAAEWGKRILTMREGKLFEEASLLPEVLP